jgi:hypothetical protein
MTDKMADTFNLPRLSEALKAVGEKEKQDAEALLQEEAERPVPAAEAMAKALENTAAIEKALANSNLDLAKHDEEMDKIATEALDNHQKLMDLGFNVDAKHAGSIFEPAVNMLRIVLDAKNSKAEKKLRLLRIELEKERLDRMKPVEEGVIENDENGIFADRNKLLEQLRQLTDSDKNT